MDALNSLLPPRFAELDIEDEHLAVDWLMYRSYEAQRKRSPHIEPERWKALYIFAPVYEKIFKHFNKD